MSLSSTLADPALHRDLLLALDPARSAQAQASAFASVLAEALPPCRIRLHRTTGGTAEVIATASAADGSTATDDPPLPPGAGSVREAATWHPGDAGFDAQADSFAPPMRCVARCPVAATAWMTVGFVDMKAASDASLPDDVAAALAHHLAPVLRRLGSVLSASLSASPASKASSRSEALSETLAPAASADTVRLKRFYEQILNALPNDLAVLAPDGRYVYVNENAIADPDVRDWIIGRTNAEYCAHRGVDPAVGAERDALVRRVADTGVPEVFQESFVTSRGERYFRRLVGPVRNAAGQITHVVGYGFDITERKRQEQALRESEERWRRLMENVQEAVMITVDGVVRYINPHGADLFGGDTPAAITGRAVTDFIPRHDRSRLLLHAATAEERTAGPYEHRLQRLDGETRTVSAQSVRTQYEDEDAIQTIIQDVTSWREAQDALKYRIRLDEHIVAISTQLIDTPVAEIDATIEDALGQIGDFVGADRSYVFLMDADGASTSNTHEWCARGISPQRENLQNLPVEVLPWWMEQMRNDVMLRIDRVADMPPEAHVEQEILDAQDIQSLVVVPMQRRDELVGFMGFDAVHTQRDWDDHTVVAMRVLSDAFTNVLQRKRVEETLRRAKREAEQASQAKSAFLANMSHEIRTPMNGVIGMTSLLLSSPLSADQREYVETIRTSGDTLLTIINDVLDFSKIEAGKLELEQQPFDLRHSIEDVLDLVAAPAAEKGLDLSYCAAFDVPVDVIGDPTRIRQILLNLLSNAVKFTEAGEVHVAVEAAPLPEGEAPGSTRDADADGPVRYHTLQIAVSDTGIGIPSEKRETLFEAFTQADISTTRRFGGTGLGLAISYRLAELMGGTLTVSSIAGEGSTFTLSLVMASPQQQRPLHLRDDWAPFAGRHAVILGPGTGTCQAARTHVEAWGMTSEGVPASRLSSADDLAQVLPLDNADVLIAHAAPLPAALVRRVMALARAHTVPFVPIQTPARLSGMPRTAETLRVPLRPSQLHNTLVALFDIDVPEKRVQRSDTSWRLQMHPEQADMGTTHPLRIIVAEDNLVNQRVIEQMLSRLGYRCDVAANGKEACQAVQARAYDLVLMDVHMPEMDGLEATRTILADADRPPRIVALTAGASEAARRRCFDAGMHDYVTKPVRIGDLIPILRKAADAQMELLSPSSTSGIRAPDDIGDTRSSHSLFDRSILLDRMADFGIETTDAPFVQDLLAQFLDDVQDSVAVIQEAVAQGAIAEAGQRAHRLKGSSATVGAMALSDRCRSIEQAANADDAKAVRQHTDTLPDLLAQTIEALSAVLDAS
jgi:PAS domain S-box-containing protein